MIQTWSKHIGAPCPVVSRNLKLFNLSKVAIPHQTSLENRNKESVNSVDRVSKLPRPCSQCRNICKQDTDELHRNELASWSSKQQGKASAPNLPIKVGLRGMMFTYVFMVYQCQDCCCIVGYYLRFPNKCPRPTRSNATVGSYYRS